MRSQGTGDGGALARTATAALLGALALLAAPAAQATVPGKPGKIAFAGNNSNIFVVNPDGSGYRRLTGVGTTRDVNEVNFAPAFSPNGRVVAYVKWLRGDGYNIRLRPLANRSRSFEGTRLFRRSWGSAITSVAWAPSGRALVFSAVPRGRAGDSDYELFTVRANGTRLKRVTRNDAGDVNPVYSPRGRTIAFERIYSLGSGPGDIWTIRQDGKRQRRLTSGPDDDAEPDFSPSGRHIAFSRDPAGGPRNKVWTMRVGGAGERKVGPRLPAGSSGPSGRSPSYSPNGRRLAFQRFCSCGSGPPYDRGAVFTMGLDGRGLRHALGDRPNVGEGAPDWGIRPGTRRPLG